MGENSDLYLVGLNIDKHTAHFACRRDKTLVKAAQGVYFRAGLNAETMFNTYGIRLARHFFQTAALTHSTAWYKRPTHGRVFIGGNYPFWKAIAPYGGDFKIVQGIARPVISDPRMYELVEFQDPLGGFGMYCATPEMLAIQLMEATKTNIEKHLPKLEMDAILDGLLKKYGGKSQMLATLQEIAEIADKGREFDRLLKYYLRLDRSSRMR